MCARPFSGCVTGTGCVSTFCSGIMPPAAPTIPTTPTPAIPVGAGGPSIGPQPAYRYGLMELVVHRTVGVRDYHECRAPIDLVEEYDVRIIATGHAVHRQTDPVVPDSEV